MEREQILDVAQVYELWNEYASAWSAGDMPRWIALWNDDGIRMPPGASRRLGKKAIREEMQPQLDRFDWQVAVYPEEVRVLGDRAYSHGSYEFVKTPREGCDRYKGNGKFLTILQRQVDGFWKIAIDCYNYDASPG